ncbi:MAG: NUMOD3 domain-containing DNA-binding protein [Candidatus Helarchaeota archaeon]
MNKKIQGKKNREFERNNKYSLANKKRWNNPEYKKRVSKKISESLKGKLSGEKHPLYGKHHSEETKEKIRKSKYHTNLKGTKRGSKNPNWKGEHIKYGSIHEWVNNNFKSKNKCEICGSSEKKLEWSNKDHRYSRKREDWQLICRSCHRRYDKWIE